MCFSPVTIYAEMHDFILSAIDSFAPDLYSKRLPGPISQFYYPFPGSNQIQIPGMGLLQDLHFPPLSAILPIW